MNIKLIITCIINAMFEEWNSWTKRQKIILSIYAIISLPLLPFMIVMIPFAHWVTQPDGVPPTKLTLMYFLTLSATMSLFAYLISIILWLS